MRLRTAERLPQDSQWSLRRPALSSSPAWRAASILQRILAHLGGTVSVLAGGRQYLSRKQRLYKDISDKGVIISKCRRGRRLKADTFPRRNRIIFRLTNAVVVIETAESSGYMTTARFAGEQGRDVLAVPGYPLDPRSHGIGKIDLRRGAAVMSSSQSWKQSDNLTQHLFQPGVCSCISQGSPRK